MGQRSSRCLQIVSIAHHRQRLIDDVLEAAAHLDTGHLDWTTLLEQRELRDLAAAHDDVYH